MWQYIFIIILLYVQRWSRGKSGRLVAKGSMVRIPLEQFVLKTRAVNSILGNRKMIGKNPTWWENSDRGNRKTAGKFRYGGKFPPVGEKKSSVAWII